MRSAGFEGSPGLLPVAGGEMTGGLCKPVSCSGEEVIDAHERAEVFQGPIAEIGGLPHDAARSAVFGEVSGVREVIGGRAVLRVERHPHHQRRAATAQPLVGEFANSLEIEIDLRRVPRQRY